MIKSLLLNFANVIGMNNDIFNKFEIVEWSN